MDNYFEILRSRFPAGLPPAVEAISLYIRSGGDVFDKASFGNFIKKSNDNEWLLKIIDANTTLPIEFFKDSELLDFYLGKELKLERSFRSSGTTGQEQSNSPFSKLGLELYRAEALTGFYAMLAEKFSNLDKNQITMLQGISLIPNSGSWPTSSLSQMVTWISQTSDVGFLKEEDPVPLKAAVNPIWVFGTAFHFVNLIDSGFKHPLPENSLIIETGGTKGKSRSVTRSELFEMIEKAFSIPRERIVSEYGMCELAAQAYDLAPGPSQNLFKFPAWVDTRVLLKNGKVAARGFGALIVHDPLRFDLPFSIRTEDMVELNDGEFQIIRRSRSAPLKGCSLNAEKLSEKHTDENFQTVMPHSEPKSASDSVVERANKIVKICRELLDDKNILKEFSSEFASEQLARFAVEDLKSSLNNSKDQLLSAVESAFPNESDRTKPWTIIAPNNHSLAAIHPIVIAFVAGIDFVVRVPIRFISPNHFINRLLSALEVKTIAPEGYINDSGDIYKNGNILVFGSDVTLSQLAKAVPGRISGYGDTIAVACADASDVRNHSESIVRDFFSLCQAGCMSARALFLQGDSATEQQFVLEILELEARKYTECLSADDVAAINGELTRLRLQDNEHIEVATKPGTPLVVLHKESSKLPVTKKIAAKAFILPVIALSAPDWNSFVNNLKLAFFPELKVGLCLISPAKIANKNFNKSLKNSSSSQSFRSFGESQTPPFSGIHQGKPLFLTNL